VVSDGSLEDFQLGIDYSQVFEVLMGFLFAFLKDYLVVVLTVLLLLEPPLVRIRAHQTVLESEDSERLFVGALVVPTSLGEQVVIHALDFTGEQPHLGVARTAVELIITLVKSSVLLVVRATGTSVALSVCDNGSFVLESIGLALEAGYVLVVDLDKSINFNDLLLSDLVGDALEVFESSSELGQVGLAGAFARFSTLLFTFLSPGVETGEELSHEMVEPGVLVVRVLHVFVSSALEGCPHLLDSLSLNLS